MPTPETFGGTVSVPDHFVSDFFGTGVPSIAVRAIGAWSAPALGGSTFVELTETPGTFDYAGEYLDLPTIERPWTT